MRQCCSVEAANVNTDFPGTHHQQNEASIINTAARGEGCMSLTCYTTCLHHRSAFHHVHCICSISLCAVLSLLPEWQSGIKEESYHLSAPSGFGHRSDCQGVWCRTYRTDCTADGQSTGCSKLPTRTGSRKNKPKPKGVCLKSFQNCRCVPQSISKKYNMVW